MKVVRFDQLVPNLAWRLPGCGVGVIKLALREAARDFCRRSQCWREEIAVNTVAGQTAYTVASTFAADIRRVLNVWLRTSTDVTSGARGQEQKLAQISFAPPTTLTIPFAPTTSVTGGLLVKVVLTPQYNAEEIGDEIIELWSHVLEAGTLARLKGQPNVPWSDPVGARDHAREFENGIAQADVDTEKQFMNVEQRAETQNWLV